MKVTTHFHVPATHPVFDGHFPGNPIIPGALLLDWLLSGLAEKDGKELGRCAIHSAKFLSPVLPGEVLEFQIESPSTGRIQFEIRAGSRTVATGSLEAMAA